MGCWSSLFFLYRESWLPSTTFPPPPGPTGPAEAAPGDSEQPEPAGGEDASVPAPPRPAAQQRGSAEQQPGGPTAGHGG